MNPDQSIVIELLAHQELKKFQEFIRNYWKEDHLFAKETSVFDWQHKGPDAYHCMVAKKRGALVGVFGFIPLSHFDNQLPKTQTFLSFFRALEDRGIGIGLRLFKNILKEYTREFIAGIGMTPRMVSYNEWLGFKVGIMDHHVALSPYADEFKVAKVPKNLKLQSQNLPDGSQEKKSSISFQKLTKKHLYDLDTKDLYLYQWPLKSDTYIKNRFMIHPVYRYEVYAISKDNMVQALCVIRPIFRKDSVVLRFVDFIGPNEAFALLHDFVLDLLKTYNAEYLDLYSYGIPSALLQEAGFINRKEVKSLIIPNYFEPFERKNVDIRCAYKSQQTYPPVRLFKADGDQDRPNQIKGDNECLKD